jgi:hypothetical protein
MRVSNSVTNMANKTRVDATAVKPVDELSAEGYINHGFMVLDI